MTLEDKLKLEQSRRAYDRTSFRAEARWTDLSGMAHTGGIRDVSKYGLFLEPKGTPERPLVPGSWVRIEFALPNGDEIKVTGEVRWTGYRRATEGPQANGFGMEFSARVPELERYLKKTTSPRWW